MDQRVSDTIVHDEVDSEYDDFLLREGLEVLAEYRSIKNDVVRSRIREMISSLARQQD